MKKISKEQFLEKLPKEILEKVELLEYVNTNTKIKVLCKDCNIVYSQLPRNLAKGFNGCPKCSKSKTSKELYLEKIKSIHKDHYDYSFVDYINSKTKIVLICKKNKVRFEQTASTVLNKKVGCPICSKKIKKTTEQFIKDAKLIHGDRYDYSLVEYKNSYSKVKIVCHKKENGIEHGIFEQLPSNHLRFKQGCPICSKKIKKTTEQFIKDAKLIHGDRYDYSLVEYKNCKTKVKLICKKCKKEFYITPSNHLRKKGCPCCKESKGEKIIRVFF